MVPFSGDIRSFSGGVRFQMLTVHAVSAKTGWWFQICFMFTPILGKIPILTSIFFRWVGSTTNQKIYENMLRLHHKKRGRLTTVNPPQCQKHPGWLQDEREPLAGTGPVGSVQLARGRTCKLIQGLLKGETAEKKTDI